MSTHAKAALTSFGKGADVQAVGQLNSYLTEINLNAKKTQAGLKGVMVEATSAATTYNEKAKSIITVVKGIGTAGQEVQSAFERMQDGSSKILSTKIIERAEDPVKETKRLAGELTKALRNHEIALKDGRAAAAAYWQANADHQKAALVKYQNIAAEGKLAESARKEIARLTAEAALEEEKYTKKIEERAAAQSKKTADEVNKDAIAQTEAAYRRLIQAQSEYVSALKAGNADRQAYWQAEIEGGRNSLTAIEQSVAGMNISADAKEKILQITGDAAQAEAKHSDTVRETKERMDEQRKATEQAEANIRKMAAEMERWVATLVVMRGLNSVWREMTEYAASYYDAMNEIRIVTNYTQEQADALGASYRQMAKEMSVSSTEIAKAAVEYWRQGLPEGNVNDRLKYTTAYAKISKMEFAAAAELMTAATNSMEISAGRVADV